MSPFARIIFWGILLLMLKNADAKSPNVESENVVTAETAH